MTSATFPEDLVARVKATAEDKYVVGFATGSVSMLALTAFYVRFFRRFPTAGWITPNVYAKKRWIKGVVVSVGDSDNFRLYHTPGIGWRWPLKLRSVPSVNKDLKDQTLHIRIAGVDAPEGSHFGRPAQPYAAESLEWLKSKVLGKTLYCQLLRPDQYSRIVATVVLPPTLMPFLFKLGKPLALEMLRCGWATTYEQAGAEYGKWGKDEFIRIESAAKHARRGMWKRGTGAESPAQYKKRYAQPSEGDMGAKVSDATPIDKRKSSGWFMRLWRKV